MADDGYSFFNGFFFPAPVRQEFPMPCGRELPPSSCCFPLFLYCLQNEAVPSNMTASRTLLKNYTGLKMDEKKRKPDPDRVAFLRSLPLDVKQEITGEEAEAFMYGEEIPESLYKKIKDFIEEEK